MNIIKKIALAISIFSFSHLQAQEISIPDNQLTQKLTEILKSDQESRDNLMTILEQKGKDSEAFKLQNKKVQELDSLHMVEVAKILDTRGWLGEDVIGQQGSIALFLVIQHADLQTQKKYLPMLEEAVAKGKAKPNFLAMLQDRVAMLDGKMQIYGSQIKTNEETGALYVHPIKNPVTVDQRRSEVGLGNLSDYLKQFGLVWDIEDHKKFTMNLNKNSK